MLRTLTVKWLRIGFVGSLLVVASLPSKASAQTFSHVPELGERDAEATGFLAQVRQLYANATSYNIAAVKEEQMNAEFSRSWSKSLTIAALAPENRYRFEVHTNWEAWVLLSDGKTEWLYRPLTQQYKKQAAPHDGPSRFKSSGLLVFLGLSDAQDTVKDLTEILSSTRSASYLPDETLDLNGDRVSCYVVEAQGNYRPGWSPDTTVSFRIWVDKKNHTIRRLRERMEGSLIPSQPQEHYIRETTTVYTAVDLHARSFVEGFFSLDPSPTLRQVKDFEDHSQAQDLLPVSEPAPNVSFTSSDGKMLSLKSFEGKPVLLDFWATWCGPCVESMPSVKILYGEAAKHGLVMLSIDEDDDASQAAFLSAHQETWLNFHDDGEIARVFPNRGIPHFVLIDSSGRVVFSKSSFDELALRTAIAELGPEYSSVGKMRQP
jgi:thiol-disulfide isomerase/thioredoxin/outer membrane lipoprotein-sorting protein